MTEEDTFKALLKFTYAETYAEWQQLGFSIAGSDADFLERTGWTSDEFLTEVVKRFDF